MQNREDKLKSVVEEFNALRAPECVAKVLADRGEEMEVEFSGTAASCSCCFDEHAKDFAYYLEDGIGEVYEVKELKRPTFGKFVVVYRKVK